MNDVLAVGEVSIFSSRLGDSRTSFTYCLCPTLLSFNNRFLPPDLHLNLMHENNVVDVNKSRMWERLHMLVFQFPTQ